MSTSTNNFRERLYYIEVLNINVGKGTIFKKWFRRNSETVVKLSILGRFSKWSVPCMSHIMEKLMLPFPMILRFDFEPGNAFVNAGGSNLSKVQGVPKKVPHETTIF